MKTNLSILGGGLAFVFFTVIATASVLKIELPRETTSFKGGDGAPLANAQCLICHSVDYISSQPPLGRTPWTATVKKMRDKYAAQLTDEQAEALVTYLVTNYGTETNRTVALTTNAAPVALGGEATAAKYGCLGCHNLGVKINGPSYKEIAVKYRNDPKAEAKIAEQIHNGGSGKWGSNLMPPFPTIGEEETKALTSWILGMQ